MALALITGSNANIDISVATISIKCLFARWAMQITAGSTSATTFCSTGWVKEIKGMLQGVGSFAGYTSKGFSASDPLVWVTASSPLAFVGTVDTSCTLSSNINVFSDGVDIVAAANAGRGVDWRTDGAVTSAWVVA